MGMPLLDDQLCSALYASWQAVVQAYQPLLEPLGITYPQYLVLLVLWEEEGLSVKSLGERLHLDSGTLTPLLKRMEAQGLLERRRDAQDERVVRLFLTAEGRRLRRRAESIPDAMACKADITLSEFERLRDSLHKLTDQLRSHAAEKEESSS
jgi:DNA-binding MarR family transcriptional regulator